MRVSQARNRDVIEKVGAVFDSYWESGEFRPFDTTEFVEHTRQKRRSGPQLLLSPIELRPEPFQEHLLEQIAVARAEGHHRNLLVSATGTGKTVMAAIDYARLRATLPRDRLLFVAHTKEILQQSLNTFRYALRDPAFGELWVDGARPEAFEHVFASVQSLRSAGTTTLDPNHYDVVVVDEFHHAAASSYRALLDHLRPRELLGLTATPERADGSSVLDWFDGRIAAELRLWEAIDQQRLVPFAYFGIADGTDLKAVPWRRGQGYDTTELTNLYTGNDAWARLVLASLLDRIDDPTTIRALGFCVSVAHAHFMAAHFQQAGIAAVAVSGETPATDRRQALDDLRAGRVNVVFSVDLFNEGVDLPDVDTLLLLRPTDSPVLFIQQLGRGLRRAAHKVNCLVLDFVGQHRKEFRYDRRFRALLGGTRRQLREQIAEDFPFLPSGCHLELDPVAATTILRNINESLPSSLAQRVSELRVLRDQGGEVTLARYLDETGLDLEDVVTANRGWSDLLDAAGSPTAPAGAHEVSLRRAAGRLGHVDDRRRIDRYRGWVRTAEAPRYDQLSPPTQRELRMLVASVTDRAIDKTTGMQAAADLLWNHPQVLTEIDQLLEVLGRRIEHLHTPLDRRPDVPLQIHAQYSRIEILAAFGIGEATKVAPWQSGVYQARQARADLLAFTLDKSSGGFSPTTRYRDYAISRELIHWESQGVTRADSETGRRYQHHEAQGSDIMLFARHRNDDRAFWFLGPATYVRHTSERPMQITWRLHHPLPGDLYASFAAAV